MKQKISIHSLAKDLELSATTISFVINGKSEEKRISNEVKERVLAYIKKLDYQPNHIAKSLRTGKTQIIAMLVEDISDPFFSSIAKIVEESLYGKGYKIFHSSTNNDPVRSRELLQIFKERQVDGYIIVPAPGIEDEISAILNSNKPLVLFDRHFPELNTTNVIVDNAGGAYSAVKHLIDNGFSNIGFVTLASDQMQMLDRLKGYQKALNEQGLNRSVLQIEYKTSDEQIAMLIKKFIQQNKSVDAILFATNYLAVSGLKAIQEMGLKVPEDMGVVGFDDNTHFALFSPSISAVAQPVGDISKNTVQLLLNAINEDSKKVRKKVHVVLPTELIIRESSVRTVVLKKKIA